MLEQLLGDIEIIWNKIKPQVADRLFDDFKSIYQDNRENSDFVNLVDSGQYVEIRKDDLSAYQQQMISSAGYRKYCSQILQSLKFFSLEKNQPTLFKACRIKDSKDEVSLICNTARLAS